jgi:hypothetical protein
MKTRFTFIVALIVACFAAKAQQVPNGGFENWTNDYTPTSWTTVDALFGGSLGFTSKDTVDKVQGNASLKLVSDSLSLAPSAGVIPGLASLGTGVYSPPTPSFSGVPFAFRPDTIFFAYEFSTPGVDSGVLQILLSKNDTTTVLGISLLLPPTSGSWVGASVVLTPYYLSGVNPDSLLIQFYSSYKRVKGSTLHVDALRLGYVAQPTAINEVRNEMPVNVYPNPASDAINITSDKNLEGFNAQIFDMQGKLVSNNKLVNSTNSIQVSAMANGTYVYRITDKNGVVVNQNKFVVNK